jgi:hypothetical protein
MLHNVPATREFPTDLKLTRVAGEIVNDDPHLDIPIKCGRWSGTSASKPHGLALR